ncbi:hypothetical protein LCGC14_0894010 [marine sediment metagenome]|uniref:Uncharacterized protein n=1 Tax=marine sediment metagenome TaxID=412755 RepID=A0A0F9P381_9ZZZZ
MTPRDYRKALKAQWRRKCRDPRAFLLGDGLLVCRILRWWKLGPPFSYMIDRTTYPESPPGPHWGHVGMLRWDPDSRRWVVIEALFSGGVVERPLEVYGRPKTYRLGVYRHNSLSCRERQEVSDWAWRQIGARYDRKKIAAIRALQLAGFSPDRVNNLDWARRGRQFICSGLFVRAYRHIGRQITGTFASPRAVGEALKKHFHWNCQ